MARVPPPAHVDSQSRPPSFPASAHVTSHQAAPPSQPHPAEGPPSPAPLGGKNGPCRASQAFWVYLVAQKGGGWPQLQDEQSWLWLKASLEKVAVAQV